MAVRQDGISGHPSDEYLAVLDDEHRQAVVDVLAEIDSAIDIEPLAKRVVADVESVSHDAVSGQELEREKVVLHHNHLPKLADVGIIEYSYEENRIVPSADIEAVRSVV